MDYIDIHCHLGWPDYDTDRGEVLDRMKEKSVAGICASSDLETSAKSVEIAEANENIWATVGIHPGDADHPVRGVFAEEKFEALVKHPKAVAVGECGLEYFHLDKGKTSELQKKLFVKQIEFALKHDKPLMLHLRPSKGTQDAYEDAIDILKRYPKVRGNIHFFAGNTGTAKKFLDLGFTMSFTGVITFTRDYDEVIKYLPQDSIMSETDAPWVAPAPHRGERNEPLYVREVAQKMAEIRGESEQELLAAILSNARRLFGIKI
jgi:TatD DNase family protein